MRVVFLLCICVIGLLDALLSCCLFMFVSCFSLLVVACVCFVVYWCCLSEDWS